MFDLGWSELLVIGVVALIVVGPKDLPKMFRTLGQITAKARSMAREFSRAMEDAADQSGVKDVARDLRGMTNPQGMGLDELNELKKWDPLRDKSSASKDAAKGKDTPAPAASAGAPGDDEEEIDRVAAEMDAMRSEAARRAAPKPETASKEKPGPEARADKPAPSAEQAEPAAMAQTDKADKGSTGSTT